MFRNLCMLRKNIFMSRFIYSGYSSRATFVSSSILKSKPSGNLTSGIVVTDINVHELAKNDKEFQRNFLTSLSTLEKMSHSSGTEPEPVVEQEAPTTSSDIDDADIGNSGINVLDKDGNPIVPIEIDGWKNVGEDDDEGPTVQSGGGGHIEIGNDNDFKNENLLIVPDKREGSFEYKGIKVQLPEKANADIGTYRFRRDKCDMETVADDIRVVKYDKK